MTDTTDPRKEGNPHRKKQSKGRSMGLLGTMIGIVGLAFASYAVVNAWDEIANAQLAPQDLAAAALVGLAGMATIGVNWIRILRVSGGLVRLRNGLQWYFVGQLGKYIPGGLWAVMGRGELASRGGISRTISYTSVGVSLVTTYAAAATVGAILLAFGSSSPATRISWIALSIAIAAVAVFGLAEPVVRRINALASRFGLKSTLPSTSLSTSLTAIVATMPAWLCIGLATALVGSALGFSVDVGQAIAATSYSWLAGFLVVPMPGGLGVREAAFIALFPGTTEEAAAIAVIARIVFIVVDLSGAALSTLVSRVGNAGAH